jgi:hypothetical protein
MNLIQPNNAVITEIRNNVILLPPGILYFCRLDKPNKASVLCATELLLVESETHNVRCLIWDIRNKIRLSGGIQVFILNQIPKLATHFDHVHVVWDESIAHSWKGTFVKRMPVFQKHVAFSFHTSIEEALTLARIQIA